ncbi:hypothetical protein F8M41_006104 [Gigaspora margarita]|uniref:Uncharacterized protein n=1 Tax=Gigaspora margarita TaxID=4874 RepID=A0A8H3X8B2_GIGMA|nr:hypothetical protein F8M41_006104 [Gigaspora margarita]
MNEIEKNEGVLKDGSNEEIIGEQNTCDEIKEKETIHGINKVANNEISILKNENDNEKICEKYVSDEINEKEASVEINKDANNELNKNINEVEANNIIIKEKSDIEKYVSDEINEKEANDGINKDANDELNKNINEVEANNSILKEKSDIELIGEQGEIKEENIEIIKEKTTDKIKIEEKNNLINKVTRENEISDEININNKKNTSSNMHGTDGSPGNSGYNGGRFYAKGRKFIHLSFLTIDISGGDGGKGQDGGNGADGLDGSDRGKNFVKERNKSFLVSRKKVSGNLKKTVEKCLRYIFTFNEKYEEIYEAYDPGQEGGNGGRGGVGGDVGSYGSVRIEIGDKEEPSTIEEKPTIIKENNKKGIDGKRGSPGRRGKNGPKYCGIYINELVFSGFRGYEEFNTKFTEETADFKKLDTKFVDGFRVATYTTTSMLTAAVIAENAMTFAIKGVFSGFRGYEESNTKFTEGTADSKDLDTIFGDGIRVLSNTTISAATAVGCTMAKTMTTAKSAMTHVIKEVDKKKQTAIKLSGAVLVSVIGVRIAIPLIISPVSSHFFSYWEKEPYKLEDNESFAFNGNSPSSLNNDRNKPNFLNNDKSGPSSLNRTPLII